MAIALRKSSLSAGVMRLAVGEARRTGDDVVLIGGGVVVVVVVVGESVDVN